MACGVHKSKGKLSRYLEGHEVYNIVYQSGLMEYIRTVPLCTACHMYLHMGRLKWLHKSRRITDARYTSIIYHGDKVLSTDGLSFRDKITGPENLVETWRLVMNGKVVAER